MVGDTMSILKTNRKAAPDEPIRNCQHKECDQEHKQSESFSFSMGFYHWQNGTLESGACVGPGGYSNHWGCSHEHGLQAARACIDEHVANFVTSPAIGPFASGVALPSCPICEKDISAEAFFISVDYVTPGRGITGIGYRELSNCEYWSCSWEHARLVAHAIVNELLLPEYQARKDARDQREQQRTEQEHQRVENERLARIAALERKEQVRQRIARIAALEAQLKGK